MFCSEKRKIKINVFRPCKVQRVSKMVKSMTLTLCDPEKIVSDSENIVNVMDNMNKMQRASLGVLMYDHIADQMTSQQVKHADKDIQQAAKESVEQEVKDEKE